MDWNVFPYFFLKILFCFFLRSFKFQSAFMIFKFFQLHNSMSNVGSTLYDEMSY